MFQKEAIERRMKRTSMNNWMNEWIESINQSEDPSTILIRLGFLIQAQQEQQYICTINNKVIFRKNDTMIMWPKHVLSILVSPRHHMIGSFYSNSPLWFRCASKVQVRTSMICGSLIKKSNRWCIILLFIFRQRLF